MVLIFGGGAEGLGGGTAFPVLLKPYQTNSLPFPLQKTVVFSIETHASESSPLIFKIII